MEQGGPCSCPAETSRISNKVLQGLWLQAGRNYITLVRGLGNFLSYFDEFSNFSSFFIGFLAVFGKGMLCKFAYFFPECLPYDQ